MACWWGGRSDDAARTGQASATEVAKVDFRAGAKRPKCGGVLAAAPTRLVVLDSLLKRPPDFGLRGPLLGHGQPFQMGAEAGESNLGAGAQPIPGPPSLSWDLPISISWTAAQIRWYAGQR